MILWYKSSCIRHWCFLCYNTYTCRSLMTYVIHQLYGSCDWHDCFPVVYVTDLAGHVGRAGLWCWRTDIVRWVDQRWTHHHSTQSSAWLRNCKYCTFFRKRWLGTSLLYSYAANTISKYWSQGLCCTLWQWEERGRLFLIRFLYKFTQNYPFGFGCKYTVHM